MGGVSLVCLFAFASVSAGEIVADGSKVELREGITPLSPQESLGAMELQDGYQVELVANEPMIEEPVLFSFDGNGRMYVAEMLTYMQDAEGTGKFEPISRIKRLEDNDGDGVMDTYTIFADKLLLPRMILTLDEDRIIVRETNTRDLWLFEDADGDGVADEKKKIFEGGPRYGNLEHQPSGLIWGIDNWLYATYDGERFRFDGKTMKAESIAYGGGQWGLGQDHAGRLYYSTAGGENPAFAFQFPTVYGKIEIDGEQSEGFREVFPVDRTPDVQGGLKRLREDGSLNHFTGVAGQSIYLGDRLPRGLKGDLFLPEPVGNLVRRAKVDRTDGYTVLSNPYQSKRKEFLVSSDANFRPVWSGTDPYGTLLVLDMYRGIIQEGNWTRKGSYLRGVIDEYGFDQNIGRGRIYRIKRKATRLGKKPQMFKESPAEWVAHLSHKNGWWRFEAQKLLVLKRAPETIPLLEGIIRKSRNASARLHALWTLDGMEALDRRLLMLAFEDRDFDVRSAGVRISERLATVGDAGIVDEWERLAGDGDIEVAQQVLLSTYFTGQNAERRERIQDVVFQRWPNSPGVEAIAAHSKAIEEDLLKKQELVFRGAALLDAVESGEKIYQTLCYTCHGSDGSGTPMGDSLMAPSFIENERVQGSVATLGRIVAHGLSGPIDGKTYGGGMMAPMGSNGDKWVADALTYIRNSFGNQGSLVEDTQIADIQVLEKGRAALWTIEELAQKFDRPLDDKDKWKVVGSDFDNAQGKRAIDGNLKTRWNSNGRLREGMWITLEFPGEARIGRVIIDSGKTVRAFAAAYRLEFSVDGENWEVVDERKDGEMLAISETLGKVAKYVRITAIDTNPDWRWIIHDIYVDGSYL